MQIKRTLAKVLSTGMLLSSLMSTTAFAADGTQLTVRVKGSDEPLSGVSVLINGKVRTTDENGDAVFEELQPGTISIDVAGQPAGYLAPEDLTVRLGSMNRTVSVDLVEKAEKTAPTAVWQEGTGTGLRALGVQAFTLKNGTGPEEGLHKDAKSLGESVKDELLAAALYYGCGGPGYEGEVTEEALQKQQRILMHIWDGSQTDEETEALYIKDNAGKRLKQVPNDFVPYTYGTSSVVNVPAVSWKPASAAAQEVTLTSANPEWTDGRDCYTLSGAVLRSADGVYAATDESGKCTLGEGAVTLISAPDGYDMPQNAVADAEGKIVLTPKKAALSPLCYISGADGEGEYKVEWYKEDYKNFDKKTAGAADMSWIIRSQAVDQLPEQFIIQSGSASAVPSAAAEPTAADTPVSTPAPAVSEAPAAESPSEEPSAEPSEPASGASEEPSATPTPKPSSTTAPTLKVGMGHTKITAPAEVRTGEKITIHVSSDAEGTSASYRTKGLKMLTDDSKSLGGRNSILFFLSKSADYEAEVTAKPGEEVSFEIFDVKEVLDLDKGEQEGRGASWSVKAKEAKTDAVTGTAAKAGTPSTKISVAKAPKKLAPTQNASLTLNAPAHVYEGDTIKINITTTNAGTSAKVRTKGLEFAGAPSEFADEETVIMVLDKALEYTYKVTAREGEEVSFELYDVTEVAEEEPRQDTKGENVSWTRTVERKTTQSSTSVVPSLPVASGGTSKPLYDTQNPPTYMLTFDGVIDGDAVPEGGLPYGTLVVSSVRPPLGAEEEQKPVIINLDENAQYNYSVLAHKKLMSGASVKLELSGDDAIEGQATLKGAKIEIVPKDSEDVLAASIVTDENGVAKTKDGALPYGSYTLRIVEAPAGIELPEQTEIPFTVTSASTVNVGSVPVSSIRAALTGRRISDETGEPLAGIPFRVTSETNGNIYTAVTGSDGRFTTAQLPYDDYLVEELSGASNRSMEKASFRIAVRESGIIDVGDITKDGPKSIDPKYVPDTAAPLQKPDPQHPDQTISSSGTTGTTGTTSTQAPVQSAGTAPAQSAGGTSASVTTPNGTTVQATTGGAQTAPTPSAVATSAPTPVPQPSGAAAKTDDESGAFGLFALMGGAGAFMAWMLLRRRKRGTMLW